MPIDGRRSTSRTTRGASSAYRSRTTNSSLPRAVDRRALARQSMVEIGSPRTYAREPATSVPWPRRRLGEPPNGRPESRYLGTSGKVLRVRAGTLRRREVRDPVRPRRGCAFEALLLDPAQRLVATGCESRRGTTARGSAGG